VTILRSTSRPRGSRLNQVLHVSGELLITFGLIVFLFIAYELWFTGLYTANAQSTLKQQLATSWAAPVVSASPSAVSSVSPSTMPSTAPSAPSSAVASTPASASAVASPSVPPPLANVVLPGGAVGIIRIPRLGNSYGFAIVEGVSTDDLKKGPGHYPGSAQPGAIGNFVVSGHRTTYLAPFNGLGELQIGDAIVIETRDTYDTYRVTSSQSVLPTDVGVVLPVPNQPGVRATQAIITLTTCNPKYSASHRLIIHGLLESVLPKSLGLPPALKGGT
jgi:sortase A